MTGWQSIRPSVRLSQNQPEGSNNRLAKAGGRGPDALPAGLVGFSAGLRLQKLSSAPRALARPQYSTYVHYFLVTTHMFWLCLLQHSDHMLHMSFFSFTHNLNIFTLQEPLFPSSLDLIVK